MSKPNPLTDNAPKIAEPVEDAYDVFVRNAVLEALNDPRPGLPSAEAKLRMDAHKARLRGELEAHFGKTEWP